MIGEAVDYLGAALALEAEYNKPESQTWLRAMEHAVRALHIAHENQEARPATTAQVDADELRRALCVIGVVGRIDGSDVIRRNSVLDIIDRRIAAGDQP